MINNGRMNTEKLAVLCLFLFYSSTNSFWGYRLFHETDIFPALACIIPVLLVLLSLYRKKTVMVKPVMLFLVTGMYAVIILSGGLRAKYILFYGMCFSVFLLTDIADNRDILIMFYYLALLFSLGSLINVLLPGLYVKAVLPWFKGSSQYEVLLSWVSKKIYPGFTNQTSFNACHFAYGIGFLAAKYSADKKLSVFEYGSMALFAVCLVLTNKRAHFLLVIAALILCYYLSARQGERIKRLVVMVIAGAAFFVMIYYLAKYVNFGLFRKFNTMITNLINEEDVTSGRLDLYAIAIKYFLENPLFGIGWEQYRLLPELTSQISTHNIYLELLCETGIVGTALFITFFIKMLAVSVENLKKWKNDFAAWFCLFMQLFFLMYGITGNPLYDPPYYIPYFMICAFAYSLNCRYVSGDRTTAGNGVEHERTYRI